ncbi:MAG: AAA family ATPase [Bacteriovoracia bacterium]
MLKRNVVEKIVNLGIALSILCSQTLFAEFSSSKLCRDYIKSDAEISQSFFQSERWKSATKKEKERLAWELSAHEIPKFKNIIFNGDRRVHSTLLSLLSNTFGIFVGEPGAAKTYIINHIFKTELESFEDEEIDAFVLQFHKMLSDKAITGFPKFNEMMRGRFEIQTKGTLAARKYVYAIFDEMEKANPATLCALLSVLNEREVFHGRHVFELAVLAGMATSNNTLDEIMAAFDKDKERPAAEALLDRLLQKIVVINHQPGRNGSGTFEYLMFREKMKKDGGANAPRATGLHYLSELTDRVRVGWPTVVLMAKLMSELDGQFTLKADETLEERLSNPQAKEYFPATQFSARTVEKLLLMTKSAFILDQLLDGVAYDDIRFEMKPQDLVHLQHGAILGGPGMIRYKTINLNTTVKSSYGTEYENWPVSVELFTGRGYFTDPARSDQVVSFTIDPKTFKMVKGGEHFPADSILAVVSKYKVEWNRPNHDGARQGSIPQFEDDGKIDEYLDIPLEESKLTKSARRELEIAKEERNTLVAQLNALLENGVDGLNFPHGHSAVSTIQDIDGIRFRIRQLEKMTSRSDREEKELAWLQSQSFYDTAVSKFFEVDYAVQGIMAAILSQGNIFLYGPAGGAKTSLSRYILNAELRGLKHDRRDEQLSIFFQQFHKLLPEGVVTGFAKLEDQMQKGEMTYDEYSSMIHRDFVFAILDEIEKANTAVIGKLLSVLNEKKAFRGGDVVSASLLVAVMTSNKTPAEFVQMFNGEYKTALAFLDRSISKIYVSNKFSSPEMLAEYLWMKEEQSRIRSERQQNPQNEEKPILRLEKVKEILDEVHFESNLVFQIAAEALDKFTAKRLRVAETTLEIHQESEADQPYVYERATSESDRTAGAVIDNMKAWFIISQLVNGTSFDKIRLKMGIDDLQYLANAVVYGGPWYVEKTKRNGITHFVGQQNIQNLIARDYVNKRQKASLNDIQEELRDLLEILNGAIERRATEIRDSASMTQRVLDGANSFFQQFLGPNKSGSK